MSWLSGKKTYILAAVGVLAPLAAAISGDLSWEAFFSSTQLSALAAAIRAGIAKGAPPEEETV